ncbi:hypothetical protein [Ferrimonas balearica]|uniref:hypothetical protein n=1 Tax=Ferrimonas balearica TaxID=44012 RepID=UPI001C9A2465|nr:hypothetical protein [Ferrimonas balearica]MBY5923540.1 hypothetical protein [Ferrimonas balearica]MBY5997911.1 hypothetical protein [Ferrimonas balearica]
MFLVSNFPNVPIATTNPATESAQREAAARVPISRPEPLLKSAAERALDPERDRTRIATKGFDEPEKEQAQRDGDEDTESGQQGKEGPLNWRDALAQARPVMERPGTRRQSEREAPISHPAVNLDKAAYAHFEQIVRHYYDRVAQPRTPPLFEART